MLTSWRSEIGKNGIAVVEDLWGSNVIKYGRDEQRKKYAKKYLTGLNYLYTFLCRVVSASAICLHTATDITYDLG